MERIMSRVPDEPCATLQHLPELGYGGWHADAERRSKAGQRQVFCTVCQKWRWPDLVALCGIAQTITAKEHDRRMRDYLRKEPEGGQEEKTDY